MNLISRAKRWLFSTSRNLRTDIEKYGQGAFIGGMTMLVLSYTVRSLGSEVNEALSIVLLFGVIIGLLSGGAVSVVFGKIDSYGSTQGVWSGVIAAVLYGIYRTVQNVAFNTSFNFLNIATEILSGLMGILGLALVFGIFGLLGGHIGYGIRRRTN